MINLWEGTVDALAEECERLRCEVAMLTGRLIVVSAERDRGRRLVDAFLDATAKGQGWPPLDVQELLQGDHEWPTIAEATRR